MNQEELRQVREKFDQEMWQKACWFHLRLAMGYFSVITLLGIAAVASYILLNSKGFNAAVVSSAGAALFVDVLGLIVSVWKVVINSEASRKLEQA